MSTEKQYTITAKKLNSLLTFLEKELVKRQHPDDDLEPCVTAFFMMGDEAASSELKLPFPTKKRLGLAIQIEGLDPEDEEALDFPQNELAPYGFVLSKIGEDGEHVFFFAPLPENFEFVLEGA